MNSKFYKLAALIGLSVVGIASLGTYFWCRVIGGCTFGRYEGKAIFTNTSTDRPVDSGEVIYQIDNSNFLFINMGEETIVTTDTLGRIPFEVNKTFYSSLFILLIQEEKGTRSEFRIYPKELQPHTTLVRADIENLIYSGAEGDSIELQLEIDR